MNMLGRWRSFKSVRCGIGAAASVVALGCGSAGSSVTTPPQGPCAAVITQAPADAANHATQGTALTWQTNPPAEGPHYPVWVPWAQAFTEQVPRGNWLHNAEHGGVILLYRCPDGCAEVATQLQAIAAALPPDPLCQSPISARWVLTPDPLLPAGVQVAAVGWGYTYQAACLDSDSLRVFLTTHYAQGPEDTCAQGAIAWR